MKQTDRDLLIRCSQERMLRNLEDDKREIKKQIKEIERELGVGSYNPLLLSVVGFVVLVVLIFIFIILVT